MKKKYPIRINNDGGDYAGRLGYTFNPVPHKISNCIMFYSIEGHSPYRYNCPVERIEFLEKGIDKQ